MVVDYLIAGQGLAGTVLAETLISKGKKVLLADKGGSSASKIAAGIYNPITGKRMVKTWKAGLIFPFLEDFYSQLEKKLNHQVLFKLPVYKPFTSVQEQNFWVSHANFMDHQDMIEAVHEPVYSAYIHDEYGGFKTNVSGYVDVFKMLELYRQYLRGMDSFREDLVSVDEIEIKEDHICWKDVLAKKIIFCGGYLSQNNSFFNWLPFVPAKGEMLTIKIENFPQDVIFNKDIFILPLGEALYKVGATYSWDFEDDNISGGAKEELIFKLEKLIKVSYKIIEQKAGIRPTVKDRRPILGMHPKHKGIGVFNGLGTKGVSLAPYFAAQFYDFLEQGGGLDPEVSIERFC